MIAGGDRASAMARPVEPLSASFEEGGVSAYSPQTRFSPRTSARKGRHRVALAIVPRSTAPLTEGGHFHVAVGADIFIDLRQGARNPSVGSMICLLPTTLLPPS